MNWTIAIADLLVVVGAAILFIWRLSDANRRMLNLEERHKEHHTEDDKQFTELKRLMQAQRDWKHDEAKPKLMELDFRLDYLERNGARSGYRPPPAPSYSDLDDSRVTSDPKKEPTK